MPARGSCCYLTTRETAATLPELIAQPRALSDLELLALVLSGPGPDPAALAVADRLLEGGSVALLRRLSPRRLRAIAGDEPMGRLLAALELGRRALRGEGTAALSSPKHVQTYARAYANAGKEHFLVVHLSTRHVPSFLEVVSIGTLNASLVHPREVYRRAIEEGTANLILVHNHPSGDPSPSADDIEITSRLLKVGELVGIEVLDHVILAGERYFSFREEGLIGG
jgi:DNA repair protein RadC